MENLKGELEIMKSLGIKPNYSALAKKYGKDRRTIKKYDEGYLGKSKTRSRPSKLDNLKEDIKNKINLPGATIKGTYEFFVDKDIGSYSNFKKYIHTQSLIDKKIKKAHPRFETEPGEQLQFDWKEDITMISKYGEIFEFNIFTTTLGFSRLHNFVYSVKKTREDVQRCLIDTFLYTGGVPKQLLTDNMSTVVDINGKKKKINSEFLQFVKDMNTTCRTCKARSLETKGKDESANRFMAWLIPYNHEFEDEKELISIIANIRDKVNNTKHSTLNIEPILLFQNEKDSLNSLPKQRIMNSYLNSTKPTKVTVESLVYFKGKGYSVPPQYINCYLDLRLVDNIIYIYYQNNLIETFNIAIYNNPINYKKEHYVAALSSSLGFVNNNNITDNDNNYIETTTKKNLENFNRIGEIVNGIQ